VPGAGALYISFLSYLFGYHFRFICALLDSSEERAASWTAMVLGTGNRPQGRSWRSLFAKRSSEDQGGLDKPGPSRWTMGILEDKETIEVPGMSRRLREVNTLSV
jgi:hypothetical protein